jgi:hypothetical protein
MELRLYSPSTPPCPGQNQLHLFTFLQLSKCNGVFRCQSRSNQKVRVHTPLQVATRTQNAYGLYNSSSFTLIHFIKRGTLGPKTLPVHLSCTYVTTSFTSPKTVGTYCSVSCLNVYSAAVLIHRSLALNWRRTSDSTARDNCCEGLRNPYPVLNITRAITKSRHGKTWTGKKCIQNHVPEVRMEETARNTV